MQKIYYLVSVRKSLQSCHCEERFLRRSNLRFFIRGLRTLKPGFGKKRLAMTGFRNFGQTLRYYLIRDINFYFGIMFTITRLYRDNGGLPLSVTFKMKCAVSFFSTTGAITQTPHAFSAESIFINFLYEPASG